MHSFIRPRSALVGVALGALALPGVAAGTTAAPTRHRRRRSQRPSSYETTPPVGSGTDGPFSIAFFASSSQNGYNQAVYDGINQAADADGNVTAEIFDGEFNAETQFNQIEDVVASGRFDGYVIVPNDPVGIAPAAQQALGVRPDGDRAVPDRARSGLARAAARRA